MEDGIVEEEETCILLGFTVTIMNNTHIYNISCWSIGA